MKRHPLSALTALYVIYMMLAGCAALGVPVADTFNEKAAAAITTVNTASQTVLTLLQAHKITPDENDKYIARIEDAQKAIDATRVVAKTSPTDAENRLPAIITGLNILLAELEQRK